MPEAEFKKLSPNEQGDYRKFEPTFFAVDAWGNGGTVDSEQGSPATAAQQAVMTRDRREEVKANKRKEET